MSIHFDDADMRSHSRRRNDTIEYRLVYGAVFGFYLLSAVMHRLLPRRWRPNLDPSGRSRTVIGEAHAAASNSLPFAFM